MAKKKIKKVKILDKKKTVRLKLTSADKTLAEKLNLKEEIMRFILASLFIFTAIFLVGAAFSFSGPVGEFLFKKLSYVFGIGYFIIPVLFLILAALFFKLLQKSFFKVRVFGSILFLLSSLGFIDLVSQKGGALGQMLSNVQNFLGFPMSIILFVILFVISVVIIFDEIPEKKLFVLKKKEDKKSDLLGDGKDKIDEIALKIEENNAQKDGNQSSEPEKKKFLVSFSEKKFFQSEEDKMTQKLLQKEEKNIFGDKVILPPLNLLSKSKGNIDAGDIKQNANIIKSTLSSFGISVEVADVAVGPTVTRYSLVPASGVRVSKISALADDLALALAAKSILVEAPIPGESLVGIEIPNKNKITVGARELFASEEFNNSSYILPLAIGKDIAGKTTIIGLEETPHMLIAGATGAGKSVTIHAIINSLLYKHGPDSLKMILIDPKRVEMTLYNNIPHLLTPVVTDPKKAILALRWAIKEMERRYEILENYKLRDVISYHENILKKAKEKNIEDLPEAMPFIVIIIDELADIMQQYPKELEAGIVSIAQKARAVGIHLILSTQRPSVNVVTGLIKANIPTRLALQVSSAIDSKTILDKAGAEKLLGQGDMLYLLGNMAKPVRIQSSFISESEVKSIVKFIKKAYKDVLGEDINITGEPEKAEILVPAGGSIDFDNEDDLDSDPLLKDAKEEVMSSGKASTSYLQRKLGIGYARAAKLIDILEEKGIVGPANGSKPRDVLVNNHEK